MEREELRKSLIKSLKKIAPDIDEEKIEDTLSLQDQLDLDSVDMLNFIVQVQNDLHRVIENKDYRRFFSLEGALAYLLTKNI